MNHLATETSPYLLQHAGNPVEWYPWGTAALERAAREDKPILLSIGYAACHWCHVMAHESFEDEATAQLMNDLFVNIKVDREERPDLDGIYMSAVQAMTGHGGWPMTVFLTPAGEPFYGGTYFPPEDRQGMPAFRTVLQSVATAYRDRRSDVARAAGEMRELYEHASAAPRGTGTLTAPLLDQAFRALARRYDERHGGFGAAPKFPQAMVLDFLLRQSRQANNEQALAMARDSFVHMARGGICDQVGGGFHRYAVDAVWLVPHFEKMLYDNALLARLGAHLYQATGSAEIARVTAETVEWVQREMTSPGGGFYASLDADSEGHEGRFYLWTGAELDQLLRRDARVARAWWGVTDAGNFEGKNILHVSDEPAVVAARLDVPVEQVYATIERARPVLYEARAARVWPGRDEKIIASWNGLMLRAVAECARVFMHDAWRALAIANGEFLFREMVRDDRVMRVHTGGVTKLNGYLEDHAAVALGALALYELTFDRAWLDRARALGESMITWFWDDGMGAFHDTSSDHEALVMRSREVTDNAMPSGTSLAVELMQRLAVLFDDAAMRRRANWVLETLVDPMSRYPAAFGHMLGNAAFAIHGALEVAISGEPGVADFRALTREVAAQYLPGLVLAGGGAADHAGVALLADRPMRDGRATAFVCRNYTCDEPVTEPALLAGQLVAK